MTENVGLVMELSDQTELSDLRKQLSAQEKVLEERYADIAILGQEIAARSQKITDLEDQLKAVQQERDRFAERVNALEHSMSWKVTAPLRKLSLALRRS
ncbi:hypothetical protein SM764_19720 [Pseudophaeobacter sp. 1A16562]|uniref:hypothetical protein n=1 Tax=unclassified Pseudophaeobacter TaxID=2637024 RepID=UPI0034D67F38